MRGKALKWIALGLLLAGLGAFDRIRRQRPQRVQAATAQGRLILGNGTEPSTLDPSLATGVPEHHIFDALFEGLVAPGVDDPDANAPGVASSWTQHDFTVWEFELRPQARWSDGRALLAEDFVWSFQRILSPQLGAEYAPMLFAMRGARDFNEGKLSDFSKVGVKALGPHRLRIELEGPAPYFPSMLKHYAWHPVPRHVIEAFGSMTQRDTRWTREGNLVGNGPFRLKDWRFGHSICVERNPHYWDAATVKLNEIVFLPIAKDATEERAFSDGQIHKTETLPLALVPRYREGRHPAYREHALLSTYFYRFNVTRPPFDKREVRQALAMAVDRQGLIDHVLRGGQMASVSFTPPGTSKQYQVPPVLRFDPGQARELLAKAGYPQGRGFPRAEILINSSEAHRTIAEAIQEMWKKHLGIEVAVLNQDWGVYLDSQKRLDYDICRAGWVGDYLDPYTFLSLWQSGDGNNQTGWSNARYDQWMRASLREGDAAKRFALLAQAEQLLLEELPVLPVYWYVRSFLLRPEVQGFKSSLLEHHCYKALSLQPAADAD